MLRDGVWIDLDRTSHSNVSVNTKKKWNENKTKYTNTSNKLHSLGAASDQTIKFGFCSTNENKVKRNATLFNCIVWKGVKINHEYNNDWTQEKKTKVGTVVKKQLSTKNKMWKENWEMYWYMFKICVQGCFK